MEQSDTIRLPKQTNKLNSFNGTFWKQTKRASNKILHHLTMVMVTWTINHTREPSAEPHEELTSIHLMVPDTKPSISSSGNGCPWEPTFGTILLIQNQSSRVKGNKGAFILLPNISDQGPGT